jgi:hypothetical protein
VDFGFVRFLFGSIIPLKTVGESKLSRRIVRVLNARGHKVWKNHGSRMSLRGLADITGIAKDGRAVVLETKIPGKERSGLSEAQRRFLRDCAKVAPLAIVSIVSSVADAIAAVESESLVSHIEPEDSGGVFMVPLESLHGGKRR